MQKLLKKCLLLLVTLPVTYLVVVGVLVFTGFHNLFNVRLMPGNVGYSLYRFREAAGTGPVDILFAGSSHTYRGFDPRIFKAAGYSSFNLGSTSQTPLNTYYLLREHLRHLKPTYIVLDVYWEELESQGVEGSLDLLSNVPLGSGMVEMALATKEIAVVNSLAAAAFHRVKTPLPSLVQQHYPSEAYIPGGFVSGFAKADSGLFINPFPKKLITYNSVQERYLQKIVELARQHHVKLLCVLVPVTAEYKASVVNYDAYVQYLAGTLKRQGVLFWDFNNPSYNLHLSSTQDFMDKDHLNQAGVNKFNQVFIQHFRQLQQEW